MEEREQLERAFEILKQFVCELSVQAGKSREYGEALWQGIRCSEGLLQELAYYHDYGEFLCKYEVAGHTLADVLVWQVDHFKLYMDAFFSLMDRNACLFSVSSPSAMS